MKINLVLFTMAVVALVTTLSAQADLQSDATEYGNKLAQDLHEHGERNQEAIYTREVTGANMYGYHSQGDVDTFVGIANRVAHIKGVALAEQDLKGMEESELIIKAYDAIENLESAARNAINEKYYQASMNDPLNVPLQVLPLGSNPLGLRPVYDTFIKSYHSSSMTAQEVYDATMKLIEEKTTVQAPSPESEASHVATAEEKASAIAQTAINKKAFEIRTKQQGTPASKTTKHAQGFPNGSD